MAVSNRITADQLAELVRDPSKKAGKDYLVVDVRDEDYYGGHIPGAINVSASEISERTDELITKYKAVPNIIFHCALSQVRGPKSARIYNEKAQEYLETAEENDALFGQKVQVLSGGFVSWLHRFKDVEPELIEAFDKKYWEEEEDQN